MKILFKQLLGFIFISVLTIFSSCKKNGGYNNSSSTPPTPTKEIGFGSSGTLGSFMVDKDGRSLYFFANDVDGKNHCTGPCAILWPTFNVDNLTPDNLPQGLDITDFGHITDNSGHNQLTYRGWPMYYYAPPVNGSNVQENPGQTGGDGLFGLWFIAKSNYTIMISNAQLLGKDGKSYKSDYTEGTGMTTYFSDGKGLTLYTYTKDSAGLNKFTKADFSNNPIWPISEEQDVVIPSILDKNDFRTIDEFGKKQLTYKNWPIHYFGADSTTRGFNKGISFPSPGIWHILNKDTSPAP